MSSIDVTLPRLRAALAEWARQTPVAQMRTPQGIDEAAALLWQVLQMPMVSVTGLQDSEPRFVVDADAAPARRAAAPLAQAPLSEGEALSLLLSTSAEGVEVLRRIERVLAAGRGL